MDATIAAAEDLRDDGCAAGNQCAEQMAKDREPGACDNEVVMDIDVICVHLGDCWRKSSRHHASSREAGPFHLCLTEAVVLSCPLPSRISRCILACHLSTHSSSTARSCVVICQTQSLRCDVVGAESMRQHDSFDLYCPLQHPDIPKIFFFALSSHSTRLTSISRIKIVDRVAVTRFRFPNEE
jgi:hypothetical protein